MENTTRRFFMGLLGLASAGSLVALPKGEKTLAQAIPVIPAELVVDLPSAHEAIELELDALRDYIRARAGYAAQGGDLTPERWQLYSTYFKDIPDDVRLTRQNVTDLMGYLTILLAAARMDGDSSMKSIVLSTVGGGQRDEDEGDV